MKVDVKENVNNAPAVKITKDTLPKKERLSKSEIKEKLAAHVEINNPKPKLLPGKTESIEGNSLVQSDISPMNTNTEDTKEKLKTVLTSGAFAFNPKERENLERILKS